MTWDRVKAWAVVVALVLAVALGAAIWYAARLSARLASTQRSLEAERAARAKEGAALDAFVAATRDGAATRQQIEDAAEATRAEVRTIRGRSLLEIAIWHDRARGRRPAP